MHGRQINTFILSINLYLLIFSRSLIKYRFFIQWNILILIVQMKLLAIRNFRYIRIYITH
ncbi:hypothetical protein ZD50_003516 [Salmonella enterica subsp. salamae]|nr:hypothetical protein [Salmonella enterica subsp. salamae]EDV5533420.1 hypothetical protein [Salmonella enterica subsp. salamae]